MRRLSLLLLAPLTLSGYAQRPPAPPDAVSRYIKVPAARRIVLTHLRVIDGTGAAPLEDQSIVLVDGKIAEIAPSASIHPAAIPR